MSLKNLFTDLIGLPYTLHGRDVKKGLDCYGLVMEVSKRMGYYAPEYGNPECDPTLLSRVKEERTDCYIALEKPEPGCLVLFCIIHPYVTHIGVVLDDCNQFIHVVKDKNVCIEKLNSISWRHRIKGFYKWTKKLD